MYLFILESIGTTELLLIGIVALIFLGPRRLPEIAKKAGKIMAEFRGTANDFKQTWEKEVNFEEEAKALRLDDPETPTVPRMTAPPTVNEISVPAVPEVKVINAASFVQRSPNDVAESETDTNISVNDKENWL